MQTNPPFCSFDSSLTLSLKPFTNKPDYSKDLPIFRISSISPFEISNVVCFVNSEGCPNPKIFLCIPTSAADVTFANPNGIKTLLVKALSTFPYKGKPVFSNGPRCPPRNPPN